MTAGAAQRAFDASGSEGRTIVESEHFFGTEVHPQHVRLIRLSLCDTGTFLRPSLRLCLPRLHPTFSLLWSDMYMSHSSRAHIHLEPGLSASLPNLNPGLPLCNVCTCSALERPERETIC